MNYRTFLFQDYEIKANFFEDHPDAAFLENDEASVRERHWNIESNKVIIDIGAAFGSYTLTALAQGAKKVIAFEPVLNKELQKNIDLNEWNNRFVLIDKGLWSKNGFVKMALGPSVLPIFTPTSDVPKSPSYMLLKVETLDKSIVQYESQVDIIKMDVEAAELEVLKGGEKLIRKHKPDLLIENHDFMDNTLADRVKSFIFGLNIGYEEVCKTPYHAISHSYYSIKKTNTLSFSSHRPMYRTFKFKNKPISVCYFKNHIESWDMDWNEPEVKERHWNINPGDVVLDIGSACGSYTLTALSQGASKVIAWEPMFPYNLFQNLKINNWEHRCDIINKALWEKNGFIQVREGQLPIYSQEEIQNGLFAETLDNSIAKNETHIDWMKIDVEGAELEVLIGGEQLIRKHSPKILIENHLFMDSKIYERVKDFILNLNIGYKEIATVPYHGVSHSFFEVI
jgi:FkbM family methyltransferase